MQNKKQELIKVDPGLDHKKLGEYLDVMGLGSQLNDKEKKQFIEISSAFGLNPFKREIYCTKYGTNLSIIVGYETYIKRAERSGFLDGWTITTAGTVEKKDLKAIITIYRKDRQHPFVHEVFYSEYVQLTKEGGPNKFWREKPVTMTKKVAIAQGFRLCFSDELGGMPYTAEEITEEGSYQEVTAAITPTPEVKEEDKKEEAVLLITEDQKKEILTLCTNKVFTQKERDTIDKAIKGYTHEKAEKRIDWLKSEIAAREAIIEEENNNNKK